MKIKRIINRLRGHVEPDPVPHFADVSERMSQKLEAALDRMLDPETREEIEKARLRLAVMFDQET